MKKYSLQFLFFFFGLLLLISCNNEKMIGKKLYTVFQNPPVEAKPFVRWWWNGDCLENKEIIRELDIMKKAGIGGIEINPIAMPDHVDKNIHCDCYDWLSPEWNDLVKSTIDEASKRDIIVDLIMGSGWPFGGRFLSKDERVQGVGLNKIELSGPMNYKVNVKDILKLPGTAKHAFDEANSPELFFLRLVPTNATGTAEVIDVINKVDKHGLVKLDIPKGDYTLFVGSHQIGFRNVFYGAPGSDGPVLDHYNNEAVIKYMNRLSEALESVLGGKLGNKVRALFCDSIELSGANWTTDFREEFKKQNGYDPAPWYQFIFYNAYKGYSDNHNYSVALTDSIRRVRYDFNNTIVNVFLERFVKPFHNWSNEHGLLSRYQAYGWPWLVGLSEGNMIPDIPESNNWIYSTAKTDKEHGFWIWNKYASSSGHFGEKKIISCESMTNTSGVFLTTLEQIKQNDDFNFITGINHSVLHGFNYSPPEAGFPGWVRYGTYFSEHNTWWKYFPKWSIYNARLSALFQEAIPVAEVAILAPFADSYSESGLNRHGIQLKPWYSHDLWESCSQLGYNTDYLNEKVIQDAKFDGGMLNYGPMSYKILFVAGAKTLQPETAIALEKFSNAGGKIIFIEHLPDRSPSLNNSAKNDEVVKTAIIEALKSSTVEVIPPPNENKLDLLKWSDEILKKYNIQSEIIIKEPNLDIYQNHFKYGKQNIYFISNQNKEKTININTTMAVDEDLVPWIWLPETGERKLFPFSENSENLSITLHPLESALIVYDKKTEAEVYEPIQLNNSSKKEIDAKWKITFDHMNGNSFTVENQSLINFGNSNDKKISSFAGTVTYETTITIDDSNFLDFGDVSSGITEVYLNGEKLGAKWYGSHLYDIKNAVNVGDNKLKIIYTTILANYMLSMKESVVAKYWTNRWQNIEGKIQQGIIGPITIIKNDDR